MVEAAPGGVADSSYISGKTTRTVSYSGKHGSVLELSQVRDGSEWATLGERRTFYL